ncbi:cytochrome P450 71B36-like [Papaver somniferum]|uniref:cytochrome P450 71B36-like n=1 Tax=Papaver somniferum TaxID=3469 RepID=UPI000E704F4B|nr:cytochrome P450 71B36-like [Papaver somniferum]
MECLPYGFFLLLPLLLLPLCFLITVKGRNDQNKPNFAPGPPKLPIIGNLHQLAKPPHQAVSKLSKIYGSVMLLQFGSVPTLVISSAEAAEQILKTLDLDFCTRPQLAGPKRLSYNYKDMAFAPYGEYWREIGKICVLELYSTKRVQSFRVVREDEVDVLIESISSSSNTTPVNFYEMLTSFTHRTLSRVAFGSTTGLSRNQFYDGTLTAILNEVVIVLNGFSATDFFPKVGWIIDRITGIHGKTEKCFHDLNNFFQQMIDEHVNPERLKLEHEDIIDVLLKLEKDQMSMVRLTNDHIKAILMNVFVAGVDSPAVTVTWAMAELAKHPKVMKKVQEEIRNYVGSKGKVEESDLDSFQYLKMVVKETLRLHPPSPLLLRESMKYSKINGYDIYPKTRVVINVWEIGRSPKYWENPQDFFPERFKDSCIDYLGGHNFEYIPFGGGRRGCPGMNMAIVLTELALANVLYAFDWELPKGINKEDINMEESSGIIIHRKHPLELVPVKYV